MIYFIIQKVDVVFSTLIPNFFFKVSNNDDQVCKINLNKKNILPTFLINSLNNNSHIEENILLMALHLYKSSMALSIFNNNHYMEKGKPSIFLLNLNVMPNYKKNILSTVFLVTRNNYNSYYDYKFSLSELNENFNLRNSNINYFKVFDSTIDFNYMYNSNFKLQKFISNNVSKNLNLSKQNR